MLRYAAENGYDRMSWTPGEQQAERYDLGKQLDSIEWEEWDSSSGEDKMVRRAEEHNAVFTAKINKEGKS